jgi:hypothetical protein
MSRKRKRAAGLLRNLPTDIESLFGDPPVLSTEDPALYWNMLDRFATCVEPTNIIEWLWIKDVVDLSWEIARLRRYRAQQIENERYHRNVDIEYARDHADDPAVYPSYKLTPDQIAARRNASRLDTEDDSASLLILDYLDTYETVDKLLIAAELRRDRILRELDSRRERIAPLLRKGSAELIDARADATPLAPE